MLSNFLCIKDNYLEITAEYNLKTNIFPQGKKIRDLKGVRGKKREREIDSKRERERERERDEVFLPFFLSASG